MSFPPESRKLDAQDAQFLTGGAVGRDCGFTFGLAVRDLPIVSGCIFPLWKAPLLMSLVVFLPQGKANAGFPSADYFRSA